MCCILISFLRMSSPSAIVPRRRWDSRNDRPDRGPGYLNTPLLIVIEGNVGRYATAIVATFRCEARTSISVVHSQIAQLVNSVLDIGKYLPIEGKLPPIRFVAQAHFYGPRGRYDLSEMMFVRTTIEADGGDNILMQRHGGGYVQNRR